MTQPPMRTLRRAEAALVLAAFLFAWTYAFNKQSLSAQFPPFNLLFWRFGIALLFGALYYYPRWGRLTWTTVWPGIVCGGFLFVGFAGQTVGLMHISIARSTFITGLFVLMVPYLGWLTLGRPLRPAVLLGALLAAGGLFLICHPTRLGAEWKGDLYTLLGAVGFAGHIVALEEANKIADHRDLLLVQLMVLAAASGAMLLWLEPFVLPNHPIVSWTIVYTALGVTLATYGMQTWAQRYVPANETGLLLSLEAVFAVLIGALLFEEYLTPIEGVGACLILASVVVVTLAGIEPVRQPHPESEAGELN